MKILTTGAFVEKNGDQYEVVYYDRVVFSDKIRAVCVMAALNKDLLEQLVLATPASNVIRLRQA